MSCYWNKPFNFNPLIAKLNPIYHLLALLGHHILHVSRIRVNHLSFRALSIYTTNVRQLVRSTRMVSGDI